MSREWQDRLDRRPSAPDLLLPTAEITPVGYVVMQHAVRADRPVKAYEKWMKRIPGVYHKEVLDDAGSAVSSSTDDEHCLAILKHFRSLMPMAQDALKPMFQLRAADGALGGHIYAVQDCYKEFKALAKAIAEKCGVSIP